MTLFIVIFLAALVIVIGIFQIKKAKANREIHSNAAHETSKRRIEGTPDAPNPGSNPDGNGTNKGDGNSAMSSGMQG